MPDLGKDVFECPLNGFEAGAVFEIAHKQQSLAMRCRLNILVMRAINAVDNQGRGVAGQAADVFGIFGADRYHFLGLTQYAIFPAPVAPAVEGVERSQPQGQTVMAGGARD
ncbi:hypothetical protein D3C76_1379950 [compost metagenome]